MKTSNLGGWENLICPYFGLTCRRTLGSYLEESGFTIKSENRIGGLMLSRFDVFLELNYELETAPNYALSVVLGIGDKKYDEGRRPCAVPYWYLLPRNRPEHRGEGMSFKSQSELESLLLQFRDNFLEPYAKPLWLNFDNLDATIANFRAEFSC
jgi:hypothetical protein